MDTRASALRVDGCIRLARHVHGCWTQQHVVLLDLKRNKYLGIAAADALALRELVTGWPTLSPYARLRTAEVSDGQEVLQEMFADGMLTNIGPPDERARAMLPAPGQALIDGYAEVTTRITLGSVARFILATVAARLLLKRRTLEQIAERVQRRRARVERNGYSKAFDEERLRVLTATFAKLRMFFFTANSECLFDSLALAEFLAHYHVFPRWVFGVATAPFAAHCWLQYEELVINDSPELVKQFTPIMVL